MRGGVRMSGWGEDEGGARMRGGTRGGARGEDEGWARCEDEGVARGEDEVGITSQLNTFSTHIFVPSLPFTSCLVLCCTRMLHSMALLDGVCSGHDLILVREDVAVQMRGVAAQMRGVAATE